MPLSVELEDSVSLSAHVPTAARRHRAFRQQGPVRLAANDLVIFSLDAFDLIGAVDVFDGGDGHAFDGME